MMLEERCQYTSAKTAIRYIAPIALAQHKDIMEKNRKYFIKVETKNSSEILYRDSPFSDSFFSFLFFFDNQKGNSWLAPAPALALAFAAENPPKINLPLALRAPEQI